MKKYILFLSFLLILNIAPVYADWPQQNISQAVFAKSIQDREPVDIIHNTNNSLNKIFFFTNIRNLTGKTITHQWIYKDSIMAEVNFAVKSNRWRVWSSKNLWHTWTGIWSVNVLNDKNEILLTKTFEFKDTYE